MGEPVMPPARPPMSDQRPAPRGTGPKPNIVMAVSQTVWMISFLVGAAGLILTIIYRDAQLGQFRAAVDDMQLDIDSATQVRATATIFISMLVILVLVTLAELLLVRRLLQQRASARWALLAVLVVHVVVLVGLESFDTVGAPGILPATLFAGQLVLAGAALVACFLPAGAAWLRGEREVREGMA